MSGNVAEFYDNLRAQFGNPRLPEGVDEHVFLRSFMEDLDGFSDQVYGLAARKLRTSTNAERRFPRPTGIILSACREAQDELAAEASAPKTRIAKRDPSDPVIAAEADRIFASDRSLALMAVSEGWGRDLWRFCAEKNRLPLACDADGCDEQWELKQISLATRTETVARRKHPGGSVCLDCAGARGANPQTGEIDKWEGKCIYCSKFKVCCSLGDWVWPYAGNAGSPHLMRSLNRLDMAIESKSKREDERLAKLVARECVLQR